VLGNLAGTAVIFYLYSTAICELNCFRFSTVSRDPTTWRHGGDGEQSRIGRCMASGVLHVPRVQRNTRRPHILLQRRPRVLRSTSRGNAQAQVFGL